MAREGEPLPGLTDSPRTATTNAWWALQVGLEAERRAALSPASESMWVSPSSVPSLPQHTDRVPSVSSQGSGETVASSGHYAASSGSQSYSTPGSSEVGYHPYPPSERARKVRARFRVPSSSSEESYAPASTPRVQNAQDKFRVPSISSEESYAPSTSPTRPWIRANRSTSGRSARTRKIATYDVNAAYPLIPPQPEAWAYGEREYVYTERGELRNATYTPEQIWAFIVRNPAKTTLWIQRTPADAIRRYPTAGSAKCRFDCCPIRQAGLPGTILPGHYRVAIDERWGRFGESVDPLVVAGYVHLYCLERFMDFKKLVKAGVDVAVDVRSLSREPGGRWGARVEGEDARVAEVFLAKVGEMPGTGDKAFRPGPEVPYQTTLGWGMQSARNETRGARVRASSSPSNVAVHLGDLEVYLRGKKGKRRVRVQEEEEEEEEEEEGRVTRAATKRMAEEEVGEERGGGKRVRLA
ncbi:hypothetical protein EJ06DRAFT_585248 [Trichodelitschia bisporula]|uniref:Uncharacterized protein n=1 Tax=Trichodelitschia bisporula TaxID=703511 RepID=A0A6G1HKI2_9PEZI|nr:hypothetical protein EJ06DRAFT_585248 [Trichodelitschia bisporula]